MDVQPVLMTQFNRIELDDDEIRGQHSVDWPGMVARYKRFNDVIREVAAADDVPLIDLDRRVPKTSRYIYDAVHVNEEGSQLVAGIIAEELAAKLGALALVSIGDTRPPREAAPR